jgi:D,D-heptose 1,7-bisphosphate phosphatase
MNRAIFLDKDGVVDENVYEVDGRLLSPASMEQLKIMSQVKEGIKEMKDMGFKIIVITNQPGVALGYLDENKLKQMNEFLKKTLEIDEIYYCPHHEKYSGVCECRKPKTGLIKNAKNDFNLDVRNSYLVGDSLSDIQTGQNAGVKKTFLIGVIREDIIQIQHQKNIFPDFTLQNLVFVANKIRELESNNEQ